MNGWTALVTEDLETQDDEVIARYGRDLTGGSDRVAISFLCHDEDILKVSLFRGGQQVGEFDSCPGYFAEEPTEVEVPPILRGEDAFADAFGLDQATVMGLLPRADYDAARHLVGSGRLDPETAERLLAEDIPEGPLELHERWSDTLGLPDYAISVGFNYVEHGESDAEWART